MTQRDKCKAVGGGSVYDRLTNPSGYTGAHATRFGTENVPCDGSQPSAPAPKTTAAAPKKAEPKVESQGTATGRDKCKPVAGGSVFDRLTNPAGYTGAHAERFDTNGNGKGLNGRDTVAKSGADPKGLQNLLRK